MQGNWLSVKCRMAGRPGCVRQAMLARIGMGWGWDGVQRGRVAGGGDSGTGRLEATALERAQHQQPQQHRGTIGINAWDGMGIPSHLSMALGAALRPNASELVSAATLPHVGALAAASGCQQWTADVCMYPRCALRLTSRSVFTIHPSLLLPYLQRRHAPTSVPAHLPY